MFGTSLTSQLDGLGGFILDAVLVPGSPAAKVFGSNALTPETSFNMSAGIVFTGIDGFLTTLDFYQIDAMLFSPARVMVTALESGRTFAAGALAPELLAQSFDHGAA